MSPTPETPADEPAAVGPDVPPPAGDLGGAGTPASEPDGDAAIGGATPVPAADAPEPAAPAAAAWTPPEPPRDGGVTDRSGAAAAVIQDRPEVAVAGAFAGGLVLAMILKRLAR